MDEEEGQGWSEKGSDRIGGWEEKCKTEENELWARGGEAHIKPREQKPAVLNYTYCSFLEKGRKGGVRTSE